MLDFNDLPDISGEGYLNGLPNVITDSIFSGSVEITLYRCSCERTRVDKTSYLTDIVGNLGGDIFEGTFKMPYDIIAPTIILDFTQGLTNASADSFRWNYMRIALAGDGNSIFYRYYFINNVVYDLKRFYILECVEDVLMTYKDIILDFGYGMVDRNEYLFNDYIYDEHRTIQLGQDITDTVIPNTVFEQNLTVDSYAGVWCLSGIHLESEPDDTIGG